MSQAIVSSVASSSSSSSFVKTELDEAREKLVRRMHAWLYTRPIPLKLIKSFIEEDESEITIAIACFLPPPGVAGIVVGYVREMALNVRINHSWRDKNASQDNVLDVLCRVLSLRQGKDIGDVLLYCLGKGAHIDGDLAKAVRTVKALGDTDLSQPKSAHLLVVVQQVVLPYLQAHPNTPMESEPAPS